MSLPLVTRLLAPARRVAVVGYEAINAFGTARTSYLTRIGRFEEAVPELARLMGLVEAREGGLFPLQAIVAGRAVSASADLRSRPLDAVALRDLYAGHIDRHIGIRVLEPEMTARHFDPQAYTQWVEVTLKKGARINGRWYRAGETVRIPRTVKMGASHGAQLPTGWDLARETGLSGPEFQNLGLVHYMMLRALAGAMVRMGRPWSEIEGKIPREQRGVAAANGIAAAEILEFGMSGFAMGEELPEWVLERYINDYAGFLLGRILGASHISTRPAACDTGPANIEDIFWRMRSGQLLFGAVATFDGPIGAPAMQAFLRKKALATDRSVALLRDHPSLVSRPGLTDRSGFVMGDGGGLLLMMNMRLAQLLGVNIYGELLTARTRMGLGSWDPAAPTGGVEDVMEQAILDIAELDRVSPESVVGELDFIEAHGTSTPAGDTNAVAAYDRVFKRHQRDRRKPVAIINSKGGPRLEDIPTARQVGGIGKSHELGGAGSDSSVEQVQILEEGVYPASVAGIDLVDPAIAAAETVYYPTRPVVANPFMGKTDAQGFGDSNGEDWMRRYDPARYRGGRASRRARQEAAAWTAEQMAAIEAGRIQPAAFIPRPPKAP